MLNQEDKKNIDNWILFLIRKIESDNIKKQEILTNLKEIRKYFFKKENHEMQPL